MVSPSLSEKSSDDLERMLVQKELVTWIWRGCPSTRIGSILWRTTFAVSAVGTESDGVMDRISGSSGRKTGHNAPLFEKDVDTVADVTPSCCRRISFETCHGSRPVRKLSARCLSLSHVCLFLMLYSLPCTIGVRDEIMNVYLPSASPTPPLGS